MNNLCLRRYISRFGRDLSVSSLRNVARWRKWWLIVTFFVVLSCFNGKMQAEDLHEASHWLGLVGKVKLTEDLGSTFQVQPRFALDNRQYQRHGPVRQLLATGAIDYSLTDNLKLAQGYGGLAFYGPKRFEHRWFQDFLWTEKFAFDLGPKSLGDGHVKLIHRSRLEERLIEKIDGMSFRYRDLLRFEQPLGDGLALILSNELFFHLNSRATNLQRGFDQNRFFLGMNIAQSQNLAIEVGYQNFYIERRADSPDSTNHTLIIAFVNNFS